MLDAVEKRATRTSARAGPLEQPNTEVRGAALSLVDPAIAAVGFVESQEFDPAPWRPDYPNPAFDERTERDIRWGARIVAAFSDDMIRAAVADARYSDPRAAEYITRVLIERRDKLALHWLGTPLPPALAVQ